MNNINRFGFDCILKRAHYILINADVEIVRGERWSHTLIRIIALDSALIKAFSKEIISV